MEIINRAIVRPFQLEDYEALSLMCAKDNHVVVAPTHVVVKDGELVGYFSLAAIPMCLLHLHTEKVHVADSFMVSQVFENLARASGAQAICTPCVSKSPLLSYMERVGYHPMPELNFYIKKL